MTKKIWLATGGKGSGKSTFCARYNRPSEIERVVVFDTEDSWSDLLEQFKRHGISLGKYIRAYDRLGTKAEREKMLDAIARGKLPWVEKSQRNTLAAYWEYFAKEMASAFKSNNFNTLVIDAVEPLEASAAAWAEANKSVSGWPSGGKGWGKAEVFAIRPLIENTIEAIHQKGVENFLLTSHIKNPWVEYAKGQSRPVLDKVKPGGRLAIWSRISTGMFWLIRPARPLNSIGAPSAIILKARCGDVEIDRVNDEWEDKAVIPPRIPMFTWKNWRAYQKNGWNPLDPREGELLSSDEKRMISELLSAEQMRLMVAGAEMMVEEQRVSGIVGGKKTISMQSLISSIEEDTIEKVKMLSNEGQSSREIASELGLKIRQVIAILKE